MLLRPYGVIVDGELELGLEALFDGNRLAELRPHTGIPEPWVLSPAFASAHSHLEYRGLQGRFSGLEYGAWIRVITEAKLGQSAETVETDCRVAAQENRSTGVELIGEHSDRPYAAAALSDVGIRGTLFQETITFFERNSPEEKRRDVEARRRLQSGSGFGMCVASPHAYQTVDRDTLQRLAAGDGPQSIHVAETEAENEFTHQGIGPIADFYQAHGFPVEATGKSVVASLGDLGYLRPNVQFVHCCAVDDDDIAAMALAGVCVAHCPRSNEALRCPVAPVRRMLEAGLRVGLGLDSAASSGPIDMFDEIRAAVRASRQRGEPISAARAYAMATDRRVIPGTEPFPGPRYIALDIAGAHTTEELIEHASPAHVRWLDLA